MAVQLHLDPSVDLRRFQWFTPEWAAVELVDRYFPNLSPSDYVLEPSCGKGSFLKAIPADVPAIGVELDPELAIEARLNSGREVICGDYCTVLLPKGLTTIIGNPPFEVATITQFMARSKCVLPELGRAGFLLPAYAMQTHNTVWRWLHDWSMASELIPRRLFPRLKLPLVFVVFTRNASRSMVGFGLYREAVEFDRLSKRTKDILIHGRPGRGVWRALVEDVLDRLGGEANLAEIYQAVEPRRPTENAFWREKIRQILQQWCTPVERGRWRLRVA